MMAQDRAKVVEHWIKVAKECRILRNFSSLHAILAALESVAVHRMKKTWGKVSRKRALTMKKLCVQEKQLTEQGTVHQAFQVCLSDGLCPWIQAQAAQEGE
ncbi:PREDICTED: ral guanine nucleotide dissociation stimulator-like isoform X2 [Myotis brandtii]|uniref:ral guanine nucleotide dissociation stimulator-like isoform X2 n=1 Tax=Myotis brandtii TaxID=109478 RepID=UPI000703F0F0|nr:PREDICTED: ral guanine nucleotide dissociation stimulator-like isoform X2 [Myotis brandtii]